MSKVMIKSTQGFDMIDFFLDYNTLSKPMDSLERVDKDTASVRLNAEYSLLLDGDFNKKLNSGKIDSVTVVQGNKEVMEITELQFGLNEFVLTGATAAKVPLGLMFADDNSYIFGNKGADAMVGIGASRFFGGAGDDSFFDTTGVANRFDGETGSDTVVYAVATSGVTVNLADNSQNAGEAAGDIYRSIANVYGSDFGDILIGDKNKNLLLGLKGDDTFVGGAKADAFDGGDGTDIASYQTSLVGVTVDMTNRALNTGDAAGDFFKSIEGLFGSSQNDSLTGDTFDNVIYGGKGDDIINGVTGNDELWGDSEEFGTDGSDTFVFTGPGTGLKQIMDFDVFDHIQISRTGFGLHPLYQLTVGTTLVITHANPTAGTNSPTFLVEQSTGNLYFDADGNGAGTRELIANVQFHSQEYLDLADFVIV